MKVGVLLLLPAAVSLAAAAPADVALADFEGDSYAPWKSALTAFGPRPARVSPVAPGATGRGFATSAADSVKDGALRGSLESPEFTIERDYLNFLIGGGHHSFRAALSLWVDGRVVRTTSGNDTDRLTWATWDLRGLRVRRSDDGARAVPILWRDGRIVVAKDTPKFPCAYPLDPVGREIVFRVFLDKGMLDVCVDDGRVFESRVHQAPPPDLGVEVFAEGGEATLLSLEAWRLAPAQITHDRLLAPP